MAARCKRLLLLGFAALVIFTIMFPDTTTLAANWIGIGRGTDLVSYLTSFAVMFLAALVYLKFKRLEDRIATLTSEIALSEWESELVAARETRRRMRGRAERLSHRHGRAPSQPNGEARKGRGIGPALHQADAADD